MEITNRAIKVLREDGWTVGALRDEQGYCLVGAISRAEELYRQETHCAHGADDLEAIYATIRLILIRDYSWSYEDSIEEWNDSTARDVDDVIGVLKLAGEELDRLREEQAASLF